MSRIYIVKPSRLAAAKDLAKVDAWIKQVVTLGSMIFKAGLLQGPHTGRIYRRRGGAHQASAPGEWPASDSGALLRSVQTQTMHMEGIISTDVPHAKFLRFGTRRMAKRKMTAEALRKARAVSKDLNTTGWVSWVRNQNL